MTAKKPRVLVIETGGTIAQRRGRDGVFRPIDKPVTPLVKGISKIADLQVERLAKLIDSTNMTTEDRALVARLIHKHANDFDGFVVIHGTDTMADTGAALTFMLQGLGKPVILTGSQISIFEPRSDGPANVFGAIKAATLDYGEVAILFGNDIIRAVRAIKHNEQAFNAFTSPRAPRIGNAGIFVETLPNRIARYRSELRLFTEFDTGIAFFYPASGASIDTFTSQIRDPNITGYVFVGFGAGNVPKVYYPAIEEATGLHKPILVLTQCLEGAADMGIYEVGTEPIRLGAISGGDMTMQAATQKLMYALGKAAVENIPEKERLAYVKRVIHTRYAEDISVTESRV